MPRVIGVVLAAGAGRRMGAPKAEVRLGGQRLVDRAVQVLRGAGCAEVVAVVRDGTEVPAARVVVNPDPGRGMRSSLALGVAAAAADGAEAVAVMLVDTPGLTAEAARTVVAAWRPGRVAVGRYGGRRGHPTVMAPELWEQAVRMAGADEGARAFLRANPELVDGVDVVGDLRDLDTPEDLAGWREG